VQAGHASFDDMDDRPGLPLITPPSPPIRTLDSHPSPVNLPYARQHLDSVASEPSSPTLVVPRGVRAQTRITIHSESCDCTTCRPPKDLDLDTAKSDRGSERVASEADTGRDKEGQQRARSEISRPNDGDDQGRRPPHPAASKAFEHHRSRLTPFNKSRQPDAATLLYRLIFSTDPNDDYWSEQWSEDMTDPGDHNSELPFTTKRAHRGTRTTAHSFRDYDISSESGEGLTSRQREKGISKPRRVRIRPDPVARRGDKRYGVRSGEELPKPSEVVNRLIVQWTHLTSGEIKELVSSDDAEAQGRDRLVHNWLADAEYQDNPVPPATKVL